MTALGIVILFQLLPQAVDLNPNDRVRLGIEVLLAAKGLNADCVLFKPFRGPGNGFIRHKLKELLQCRGISEGSGMEDPMNLLLALLGCRNSTLCGC